MLAYTYPISSILWIMFVFFFYAAVFVTVIYAFIDIFRRRAQSGWAKAAWALVIIILPLLGTLIYLIARPAAVEVDVV